MPDHRLDADETGGIGATLRSWLDLLGGDAGSDSVEGGSSGGATGDETTIPPGRDDRPVAATDGGSEANVGTNAGTDGPEWRGDDPIVFDTDDSGGMHVGDPVDDGTKDPVTTGTDEPVSAGVDDPGSADSDEPVSVDSDDQGIPESEGVSDGDALLSAVTGSDATRGDASQPDGASRQRTDERDELERRIDDAAAQQRAVDDRVASLEDEVGDLRTTVESLQSDVARLVRLATGVAAASAAGADGAVADDAEGTSRVALDAVEPSTADPAVPNEARAGERVSVEPVERSAPQSSDADGVTGADRGDDSSTSADRSDQPIPGGRTEPIDRDGGADVIGAAEFDAPSSDGDSGLAEASDCDADVGDSPVDAADAGDADRSAAVAVRELVDPTSEAVGARLRQFREQFGPEEAGDASGDAFQFGKVLLPGEDGAVPELASDQEKPYLESLPGGYAAETAVIEWLDWLVSETDRESAARAIAYYETVEWLSPPVAEELVTYLEGVGTIEALEAVEEPPEAMDLEAHLHSLRYVTALGTGEVAADGV